MTTVDVDSIGRKEYQRRLKRRRQRRQKRRKMRTRQIRMLRMLRTVRFWTRFLIVVVVGLGLIFWSRFAVVYQIPAYAVQGSLQNVSAYVTVKEWWFGPPVFDISAYANSGTMTGEALDNPYHFLLSQMGRYQTVLTHPDFIWVKYTDS
jgi:hypothetical protein